MVSRFLGGEASETDMFVVVCDVGPVIDGSVLFLSEIYTCEHKNSFVC